ncbi:1-acyl-sn-glycerol-3-phosphate acyltransferase [Candidatus Pelagibacter sp.]|nr:1-acyl-sn-glycerol-3-phosphate acyltransferase [Candidatus Pelagibacter sp.]
MIRNFLFSFSFFSGIVFISIIFLPSLLLPQKITLLGGKLMGYWSQCCLKIILSTTIVIKGKDNMIKDEKFFIASSHQSMFETFFLQTIFNSPVFILKNELIKIPIFGWYLKKIGSIPIKRDKITKDNLNFFEDISEKIQNSKRPIVIFPQATRVLPEDRPPFRKGASRIYEELDILCQPVAINSGYVWPKQGIKKTNKVITISILKPIKPGLQKEEFLKMLEKNIYDELDLIG